MKKYLLSIILMALFFFGFTHVYAEEELATEDNSTIVENQEDDKVFTAVTGESPRLREDEVADVPGDSSGGSQDLESGVSDNTQANVTSGSSITNDDYQIQDINDEGK